MTNFWTRKKTGDIYKHGTSWADLIRECRWRSRLSPLVRCCNSQRLGGAGDITGNRRSPRVAGRKPGERCRVSHEMGVYSEGGSGQLCPMLLRVWWEDDRRVPLNLAM